LADIAVSIHACRLVVHEAAWKADSSMNVKREAAMVKLFATQMIRTVADRVSHVFNGPPYIQGLPMQRLCSDALAANATDLALELQSGIIAGDIMKGLKV
jgi:alkylation response protein AidB-like acyl-CoA dehydrogenase